MGRTFNRSERITISSRNCMIKSLSFIFLMNNKLYHTKPLKTQHFQEDTLSSGAHVDTARRCPRRASACAAGRCPRCRPHWRRRATTWLCRSQNASSIILALRHAVSIPGPWGTHGGTSKPTMDAQPMRVQFWKNTDILPTDSLFVWCGCFWGDISGSHFLLVQWKRSVNPSLMISTQVLSFLISTKANTAHECWLSN